MAKVRGGDGRRDGGAAGDSVCGERLNTYVPAETSVTPRSEAVFRVGERDRNFRPCIRMHASLSRAILTVTHVHTPVPPPPSLPLRDPPRRLAAREKDGRQKGTVRAFARAFSVSARRS